jgi:hypothetical protein
MVEVERVRCKVQKVRFNDQRFQVGRDDPYEVEIPRERFEEMVSRFGREFPGRGRGYVLTAWKGARKTETWVHPIGGEAGS